MAKRLAAFLGGIGTRRKTPTEPPRKLVLNEQAKKLAGWSGDNLVARMGQAHSLLWGKKEGEMSPTHFPQIDFFSAVWFNALALVPGFRHTG